VSFPLLIAAFHKRQTCSTQSQPNLLDCKVLLAYPMRRELQREAAGVLWRLDRQPGCEHIHASAPLADAIQMQRLAMEHGSLQAAAQAGQPAATVTELKAEVAAMARLLDAFDVADEQRSFWWIRDGTHASALLQRHFGFVLRAGQRQAEQRADGV
jgi:hypothetical protein